MTRRTESFTKSAIEIATEDAVDQLNIVLSHVFKSSALPIYEKQFRRIVALYFERQTISEWCHMLGVEPTPDDIDASRSQS
jgi:hypothetical protein